VVVLKRRVINSHGQQRRTTPLVNHRILSRKYTSLEAELPIPTLFIEVHVLAIEVFEEHRIPNVELVRCHPDDGTCPGSVVEMTITFNEEVTYHIDRVTLRSSSNTGR
jgi:hypothetical protein